MEIAAEEYLFMVDMHHIISDGTSIGVLMGEFMALYEGGELPQLRLHYKDYAEWETHEQAEITRQEAFWLKEFGELADDIPVLDLPLDYFRPKVQDFEGNSLTFEIDSHDTGVLKTLALQRGATLYMVLLALYNIFLITGAEKYKSASAEKIEKILSLQSEDGYYPEYGGCDIGYMSICLGYLTEYCGRENREDLRKSLEKAEAFVNGKIGDYGSYDWRQMSRKTQYIYPYGFAKMNSAVTEKHINGLRGNRVLNPAWMDDRFCLPLAIDYLRTYIKC